jgi:PBSX family phage terminase large subunit
LNIWDGSVRSGKTVASLFAFYIFICKTTKENAGGLYLITGVTLETIEKNILIPLSDWLDNPFFSYSIGQRKAYFNDGQVNITIHLIGGNDEKSQRKVRGTTIFCCYCDEISLYPQSFWMMMLRGLSPPGARLFGTTNPDTPTHYLKRDFLERKELLDLNYFHFTLDDNPFLTAKYKKSIKQEFVGLWYKRFILGLWVAAAGAVYDMFSEEKQVIDTTPFLEQCYDFYISIDYGTSNPCTFGLFGRIVDKIYLFREYYWDSGSEGRQKTDSEYGDDLKKFIDENLPKNQNITRVYIDPSALSFRIELENRRLPVEAAKNDVLLGIKTVSRRLEERTYLIDKSCTYTIKEYYSYIWDKNIKGKEQPSKQNDHTCDRDRYLILSLESYQKLEWESIDSNNNEYGYEY